MESSSKSRSYSLSPPSEQWQKEDRNKRGFVCTPALFMISAVVIVVFLIICCVSTYWITRAQLSQINDNGQSSENLQKPTFITMGDLRLPKKLKPASYTLVMKIYLPFYVDFPTEKNLTSDGEVVIDMVVLEPTNSITLNMKDTHILSDKCEAQLSDEQRVGITSIAVLDRLEKVIFILDRTLRVGENVKLKVTFTGAVNDGLFGLYRNAYRDSKGNLKFVIYFTLALKDFILRSRSNKTQFDKFKEALTLNQRILVRFAYPLRRLTGGPNDCFWSLRIIAAVTQMAPANARRMVPCFDEPEYKATWNVTIIHPIGTRAIANSFEISETTEPDGNWKVSKFQRTPVMSSYLLAIFVSEFDFDESYTKRGVRFRVWSAPDTKERRMYGLKTAVAHMETLEKYFAIEDVVMKQDLVALERFVAGAMENWGLITFSEFSLLPPSSIHAENLLQGKMIAHELTHQWFGNLVTTKWWNEIWLNEGFASYFQQAVMNEEREMRISKTDHVTSFKTAMNKDSLASSRPLSSIIDIPLEIIESFDSISYTRGAITIAMIRDVVGEQNFRKALIHYLKKFSFENTHGDDLWEAFDEVVEGAEGPDGGKLSMVDFGPQWSKQMGFPLVTVEHFNSTTLRIRQERYMKVPHATELRKYRNSKYGYKWDVPLWYQWDDKQVYYKWLKREEPLYLDRKEAPIVINVDRRGYFVQNYDSDGWKRIIRQFDENHRVYSPHTRYTVISDAFNAALIGRLDYKTVFALLKYLSKEEDDLVWEAVTEGFDSIRHLFGENSGENGRKWVDLYSKKIMERRYMGVYSEYISGEFETHRNGSRPLHQALGYGKKKHYKSTSGMSRYSSSSRLKFATSVIESYCEAGSNNCSSTFQSLFEKEVLERCSKGKKASQCVRIPKHLRKCTYCYGVKRIGSAAIEKIKALYNNEDNVEEKDNLAKGLTCANEIQELKTLLRRTINETAIEGIGFVFAGVAYNPISQVFLTNFLIENWEAIYERLGHQDYYMQLSTVIGACLSVMHSNAEIMLVKHFQEINPNAQQFSIINEKIEEAQHRIAWLKKHSKTLTEFFKSELGQTETFS